MAFEADRLAADFGSVRIFVDEYSFSRSAKTGETVFCTGMSSVYNAGSGAVKIKFSGTTEKPCVDELDRILCEKVAYMLFYGGMIFEDAVLVDYCCEKKAGGSERVTMEIICEKNAVTEDDFWDDYNA